MCIIDDCEDPSTQTVQVKFAGRLVDVPLCDEHARDLDWGVIGRNDLLRAASRAGMLKAPKLP